MITKAKVILSLIAFIFLAGQLVAQDESNKKVYRLKSILVDGTEVQVLTELLDSGKISLYRAIDFYLEIPGNSQPIKLISKNKYYITQLKNQMADCPVLADLIPKTKFKGEDLTNIVRLYNSCSSIEKKSLYTPTFNATLGFGLSFAHGFFLSGDESNIEDLDYSFKPLPNLYFSGSLVPPRNSNVSFGIEISLLSRKLNGYSSESELYSQNEKFLSITYRQVSTGFQFTHYITRGQVRPFYSLGIGMSFSNKVETRLWDVFTYGDVIKIVSEIPTDVELKNQPQFNLSIGAKLPIYNNLYVLFELRLDAQFNQIISSQLEKSFIYSFTPVIRLGLK